MKKFISIFLCFAICCLCSCGHQEDVVAEPLEDIINRSDIVVMVSSFTVEEKTKKIDGAYHTRLGVIHKSDEGVPEEIVVVHNVRKLKKEGFYILCLNKGDKKGSYNLQGGENGIIKVTSNNNPEGGKLYLHALNEDYQEQVEELMGTRYEHFAKWLAKTYDVFVYNGIEEEVV